MSVKPAAPYFTEQTKPLVGGLGHLALFMWVLAVVLLSPLQGGVVLTGVCLFTLALIYPTALRQFLNPRFLLLMGILLILNITFADGEPDVLLLGLPISKAGVWAGVEMTLRAVIILLAANGLAGSVDITEMAGVFERVGLHGLGFALGVAINFLPNLRQSSRNAWHSLRMRGGMRANWWRGVQLLLVTIVSNALRRSEEIVMAAEVRAFHPDRVCWKALRTGYLDKWLVGAVVLFSVVMLLSIFI